jgi:hypothetical protein
VILLLLAGIMLPQQQLGGECTGPRTVAGAGLVKLDVNFTNFLARNDHRWQWQWRKQHVIALGELSSSFQSCHRALVVDNIHPQQTEACCVVNRFGMIILSPCSTAAAIPWRFDTNGSIAASSAVITTPIGGDSSAEDADGRQQQQQQQQQQQCLSLLARPPPPPQGVGASIFAGYVQLAEATGSGCNKDARGSIAGQCCLGVPGSQVSGCHHPDEPKWNFNEFFAIAPTMHVMYVCVCCTTRLRTFPPLVP